MNANSTMLHVRLDHELKTQATDTLAAMGLTTADAVRLLFHRIVADQAFPLELKVPHAQSRAAIAEAKTMMGERKARFANADSLLGALDGQD